MPRIFVEQLTIGADSIDLNGHVNNQEYVRWMQDVATAHSSAQGWNMARYLAAGVTWVIRSHFIEYLRPAFQGDELLVATWISAASVTSGKAPATSGGMSRGRPLCTSQNTQRVSASTRVLPSRARTKR
jgi:acyl-CoA thioesterase FadM